MYFGATEENFKVGVRDVDIIVCTNDKEHSNTLRNLNSTDENGKFTLEAEGLSTKNSIFS